MDTKEWICHIHRRLTDPEDRSVVVIVLRVLLWPLAAVYGGVAALRNVFYETGLKRIEEADVPVISVGNITVGGTGKTPFVVLLCERLMEQDVQPVVLSRGYGADSSSGVDDENDMLKSLLPEVPLVVNPDRAEGARTAVREHDADVLVMDDGFQHRRLARDCDIVLVDALDPFGNGFAVPLGSLREPISGLSRADVIVLTHVDQVPEERLQSIRMRVKQYTDSVPIATAQHTPVSFYEVGSQAGEEATVEDMGGEMDLWGAFCGIGNPEAFLRTLENLELRIKFFRAFPDHHAYTDGDLEQLGDRTREEGGRRLLTTEKDAAKIQRLTDQDREVPIWALRVRMTIATGKSDLWAGVDDCLVKS